MRETLASRQSVKSSGENCDLVDLEKSGVHANVNRDMTSISDISERMKNNHLDSSVTSVVDVEVIVDDTENCIETSPLNLSCKKSPEHSGEGNKEKETLHTSTNGMEFIDLTFHDVI